MKVNFLDLKSQFESIKFELIPQVMEVFEEGAFILGRWVQQLESLIAELCQTSYAIGCASGSDAILLSLMALDIGMGDEVITTPFTFFSTAGSVSRLGAIPVFCDIDPITYNIDPEKIEPLITERTKAIIPVHLYGQCADMEPIMTIARKYGIPVIEDAAQAIYARYRGKPAGSMGLTGCLSFFPSKNLGGAGDGGMVVTSDEKMAHSIKSLRVHGSYPRKYYHSVIGMNSRLDSIQAAVLIVKLKYLEEWTEKRRSNAERYRILFSQAGLDEHIVLPVEKEGNYHVYNQFVIRVKERDALVEYMKGEEVDTQLYYPLPLHLQKCYSFLGKREGDLVESERAAKETLALPIYPEMPESHQMRVVEVISNFFRDRT